MYKALANLAFELSDELRERRWRFISDHGLDGVFDVSFRRHEERLLSVSLAST